VVQLQPSLSGSLFNESELLNAKASRIISEWIPTLQTATLLYKGTRDGFKAASFHAKCDNKGPTLTVVESNNSKIFGGFSEVDWNQSGNYKNSSNAFLFSVSVTETQKYPVKVTTQAIYCHTDHLATFGGGHDFYLIENCNTTGGSYSNFGHSYNQLGKAKEILAGSYNFSVKEIEIYQLKLV